MSSEADRIRSQQQEMIGEQDVGLKELSRAAKSQQKMGLAMQDEIQEQNGQYSISNLQEVVSNLSKRRLSV